MPQQYWARSVVGVQMSSDAVSQTAACCCGIQMSTNDAISPTDVTVVYKWVIMPWHNSAEHGLLSVYKWAVMLCHKLLPVTVVYRWALMPWHNSAEHGLLVYKWAAMLCHKPLSVDTAVCWCYCGVQMSSDVMSPTAVGYCGVQMRSIVVSQTAVC